MAIITLQNMYDAWKKVSDWVSGADTVSAPAVKLAGRKATFKSVTVTTTTTINSSSNEIISPTVPVGKLWTIQDVNFKVDAPASASSGTHIAVFKSGSGGIFLAYLEVAYNNRLQYAYGGSYSTSNNTVVPVTKFFPDDTNARARLFKDLKVTSAEPFSIVYYNLSNVQQTNARTLTLTVLEEDIAG